MLYSINGPGIRLLQGYTEKLKGFSKLFISLKI